MKTFFKLITPELTLGALLLTMLGCADTNRPTLTTGTAASPLCAEWKAISYSSRFDSDATVRQIIAGNAARAKLCGS